MYLLLEQTTSKDNQASISTKKKPYYWDPNVAPKEASLWTDTMKSGFVYFRRYCTTIVSFLGFIYLT